MIISYVFQIAYLCSKKFHLLITYTEPYSKAQNRIYENVYSWTSSDAYMRQ